ncbi:hypothetical protein [Siphonobacter sp. BAB-5405]|uniref:hypothetical protein n=1 Tax=Siphonobacter sp. BAB-5405 TaxID=1864825 RepID=UPI000C80E459|nr:hypothetical protein [Siphonobacter sp. BAB-5405]
MKRYLVAFAMLLFSTYSFAQFGSNRNRRNDREAVTFFSNSNYRGQSVQQYSGDFRTINFSIGSIRVPNGYVVEAFSEPNFRGQSVKFSGNVAQSGNQIRSLRIVQDRNYNGRPDYSDNRPGRGRPDYNDRPGYNNNRPGYNDNGSVVLFADDDYQGGSVTLNTGRYRSSALGQMSKKASSIQVPAGYSIQVFENDSFTGNSYTLTSSNNRLRNIGWNDRIGSMIITRGGRR